MNTPSSPAPKKPLVVSSGMNRRDILLAAAILISLLGFVVAAIYSTGTAKSPNMLTGVIQEKYRSGEKERELTVSAERGKRGVSDKVVDSGCYLKVFVEKENKTYDVMLAESEWNTKKVGEKIDFLRPASERK